MIIIPITHDTTSQRAQSMLKAFFCAMFLLATFEANASEIIGKIIRITDGDTLTLLTSDKQQIKIRLAEIDTPEKRQPYGQKARQELSELAFNQHATVISQNKDRYGRTIGVVMIAGKEVNREMVNRGAAWVYRKYNHDKSLLHVEDEARSARRGLWSLPQSDIVPPWEWRSMNKPHSARH